MEPSQERPQETSKIALSIPVAIVLAGIVIAGAILLTKGVPQAGLNTGTNTTPQAQNITIRPVTDADHILGNPNAPIVIVEYSDTECPFCKQFQVTLHAIVDKYGKDGQVAWVYRQFPLAQLHSKAPKEAEATECAAELGGKSAFWDYIDKVFAITPSNDGLDPSELLTIASQMGLDQKAFKACLDSGKYAAKIQADYNEAIAAGARGTPHTVILTKNGDKLPLEGAQPLAAVESIIDGLLKAK
jgi:protein-disulfide isomerase